MTFSKILNIVQQKIKEISGVVGENTNNGQKPHNQKPVEERAYWGGKQGKTPGGIGFALTFLLLLFLCVKTKKSKRQLYKRSTTNEFIYNAKMAWFSCCGLHQPDEGTLLVAEEYMSGFHGDSSKHVEASCENPAGTIGAFTATVQSTLRLAMKTPPGRMDEGTRLRVTTKNADEISPA